MIKSDSTINNECHLEYLYKVAGWYFVTKKIINEVCKRLNARDNYKIHRKKGILLLKCNNKA